MDRHLLSEKPLLFEVLKLKYCWIIIRVNAFSLILFHFSPISSLFPNLITHLSSLHPFPSVLGVFLDGWYVMDQEYEGKSILAL